MTVTDEYGATKEELEVIRNEADRLSALGYKVPNIRVKFIPHAQGFAGLSSIHIHPNSNLAQLRFTVAHEIGHHNEPEPEALDIWNYKSYEKENQESEDFANWFAANI